MMMILTIFPDVANLIEGFFDNQVTRNAANQYVTFTRDLALFMAPLFYSISFVWSYAKETFKNSGNKPVFFEREKLLRGLIIWGLITLYIPIFGSVELVANKIVDATHSESYREWRVQQGEALKGSQFAEGESDGNSQTTESESEGGGEGDAGMFDLVGALKGALNSLFYSTLEIFAFVIKIVIVLISIILGKVFYILGPFVLLFSILPNNEDKLRKWFNTWLLLLFNPLTCNLLSGFLASLALANTDAALFDGGTADPTGISDLIMGVVIIVMYVLTFWVTSFIVGIADAGKVVSTAVSGAGMVASGGASAAASAAGGSGAAAVPDMKKVSDSAK